MSRSAHHFVAVVQPQDELLEEPAGLVLGQAPLVGHMLEHVAPRRILHRDAQVVRREEHLPKLQHRAVKPGTR